MCIFFKELQIVLLPTFATLFQSISAAAMELTFTEIFIISSSSRLVPSLLETT